MSEKVEGIKKALAIAQAMVGLADALIDTGCAEPKQNGALALLKSHYADVSQVIKSYEEGLIDEDAVLAKVTIIGEAITALGVNSPQPSFPRGGVMRSESEEPIINRKPSKFAQRMAEAMELSRKAKERKNEV